jgi:hypothetical protein
MRPLQPSLVEFRDIGGASVISRGLVFFLAAILSMSSLASEIQPTYPVVRLSDIRLSKVQQENLQKALITEAPGLVIVVDNQTLMISAFVSGVPERMDSETYLLVDVFKSSNGVKGKETPQGIFKLFSGRMKENDFSFTYRKPLSYTMFWQDLWNKSVSGVAFHAASHGRENLLGKECGSAGCVLLAPFKSKDLFLEVVERFSSQKKGSDVLVVSADGSNSALVDSEFFFSGSTDYHERWRQITGKYSREEIKANTVDIIRLSPIQELIRERILVDARRPIAGNGDTASSMFLVQNLIKRGFNGKIDVLIDERSERIFQTLSRNLPAFQSAIRLIREANLETDLYSLVIRSGLPSGRILDSGLNLVSKMNSPVSGKINIDDRTLFLSLTIYGNTQNRASVQPLSLASKGGLAYLMPAPGLGVVRSEGARVDLEGPASDLNFAEVGIFRDPFSLSIRKWSLETAEKFLLKQSGKISADLQNLIAQVIDLRIKQEIKYSLAYGFSIPQVKMQARDYFRGLLSIPTPVVVFTPSAFSEDLLNSFTDRERERIKLTSLKELVSSGGRLQCGHVTIIQIPNIPHHVFATMLLASHRNRIVPLGAGDGFFTTALSLGIPFAPTIVDWNIRNVRALSRLLQIESLRHGLDFSHMQSLRRIYSPIPNDPIKLAHAQQLLRYQGIFRTIIEQIPDLIEYLDAAVGHLRNGKDAPRNMRLAEELNEEKIFSRAGSSNAERHMKISQTPDQPQGSNNSCSALFN